MTKKKPKLFNKSYQKEWSETHRYKHRHTGEHCTFESFIAEYLILRWTEEFKMDKPSYKFWTKGDKYHDAFMRNMKAAKQLKKKFDPPTIIAAVRSEHFKNVYHIGIKAHNRTGWKYNPVAIEAVKRYHKEHTDFLKLCDETAQDVEVPEVEQKKLQTRKKQYSQKKNSLNKLRNK